MWICKNFNSWVSIHKLFQNVTKVCKNSVHTIPQKQHIVFPRYNNSAIGKLSTCKTGMTKMSSSKFSSLKKSSNSTQDSFKVTAYATAEEYKLEKLSTKLEKEKFFELKNLPDDASNVLHVEYSPLLPHHQPKSFKSFFIFREGSIVFWNFETDEKIKVLNMVKSFQSGSYNHELILDQMETLDYIFTETTTDLVRGNIHLKKISADCPQAGPLELFAFSNAIALSVKLAIWEASLDLYASSIEYLLEDLKNGKTLRISESEVLKKTGELFTLSHLINLSSGLMDTPDFYWDREHLEKLYHSTYLFLNVPRRTRVMNSKLAQCVDFMELLRDYLKDKHHTRLELMIIFLIFIEVVFGSYHFYDKYYGERIVSSSTEEKSSFEK